MHDYPFYNFQISSMIEIEVELELDVVAAEAVSNVVYGFCFDLVETWELLARQLPGLDTISILQE